MSRGCFASARISCPGSSHWIRSKRFAPCYPARLPLLRAYFYLYPPRCSRPRICPPLASPRSRSRGTWSASTRARPGPSLCPQLARPTSVHASVVPSSERGRERPSEERTTVLEQLEVHQVTSDW